MDYPFKVVPYEHQLQALNVSWNKNYYAYFMDMGTGKSKVLIDNCAILYDNKLITSALIVAPKGVYRNWLNKELPEHLPDHIPRNIVAWTPDQTLKKLDELSTLFTNKDVFNILLMNVEAFSTDRGREFAAKYLRAHPNNLFAVDESTTIKGRTARRTKAIVKLGAGAKYRRILTGSPVTRSPLDLYTQCEFLRTACLGHNSFWTFQTRYAKMIRRQMGTHTFNQITGYQNLTELNAIIKNFSYRVRKEDCLDLPDKVYVKRTVELTPEQKIHYSTMKAAALSIIEGSVVSTSTILTQILRLQQICSGFVHMDDGTIKEFPTNKLNELLQVVEETDGKIIIWTNFTHDLKKVKEALEKAYGPESAATFYGETPDEERQLVVKRFQDPTNKLRFFIGQPRTGGYGLTLTAARTVIYYSNGYDLEIRLQSEDRAHRIGQTNKVTYVDIIVEKSVDEKILKALRAKINIASTVMAEGYRDWII